MGNDGNNTDNINAAPFDDPEERKKMRLSHERVGLIWPIIRPIHAVVSNWKALALVVATVIYLNRPEIISALRVLAGAEGQ